MFSLTHQRFVGKRKDVAVVCFATGDYYIYYANILVKTFRRHNLEINVYVFDDVRQIGSPTHQEIPYAFKYYAIQKVHSMGYRIVLWCDSVLKLQRSIISLLPEVCNVGVYLQEDGWKSGMWANDRCLEHFKVTRDEAMNIPAIWACFMGFDFQHPRTEEFMKRWKAAMDAGAFHGRQSNEGQTESSDPRCRGHRHDQSCAELIAYQMKLPLSRTCIHYDPAYNHRYFVGREW